MRAALSRRYSADTVKLVLDWFRNIQRADERDLVGGQELDGMLVFTSACGNHDLYNSLMARLLIYAPLIAGVPGQALGHTSVPQQ